jgi:hypothetical protein
MKIQFKQIIKIDINFKLMVKSNEKWLDSINLFVSRQSLEQNY